MKNYKNFIKESINVTGFTGSSTSGGPVAGFDKFLFPRDDDLLSQDFQTPAESGEDKWARFFGVVPVMKLSLKSSDDDGPSIDQMVSASKEFVNIEAAKTALRLRKTYGQFMGGR